MVKKLIDWMERGVIGFTFICIILLLMIQVFSRHEQVSVINGMDEKAENGKEIAFLLKNQKSNKLVVLINGEDAGNFITGYCKIKVKDGDVIELIGLTEAYTVKVIEKDEAIKNRIGDETYKIYNEIKYVGKMRITN